MARVHFTAHLRSVAARSPVETGGLWFSGDGGESWNLSPARLPPIYAVDFA